MQHCIGDKFQNSLFLCFRHAYIIDRLVFNSLGISRRQLCKSIFIVNIIINGFVVHFVWIFRKVSLVKYGPSSPSLYRALITPHLKRI